MTLTQVVIGCLLVLVQMPHQKLGRDVGMSVIALEVLFMATRSLISSPLGWLKFSHGDEVKLTASALVALGDMAIHSHLEGWTFHFLAGVASAGAIFITLLVPVTGHLQIEEEQRDLLQGHRFWKCLFREHAFIITFGD
ncbi:hypothetical protein CDL15_Pgr004011 [Punica granatum]|nr:hypothetical protein CDL15_Pgr004011 [Punica granatum]